MIGPSAVPEVTEVSRTMWRIDINGQGVEITNGLRCLVEDDLRAVLQPYGSRVAFAHVRLWEPIAGDGPATCYIRVDLRPSGGVALGATAEDVPKAVRQASARIGTAIQDQLARPAGVPGAGSYSWFRI
jgi:hypothetical protein